jgi:hypothetical protein
MAAPTRFALLSLTAMVLTAGSLLLGSCAPADEPEVENRPAMVFENTELRLRLSRVPAEFVVVTNDGDQLVLDHSDAAVGGRITIANRPPEAGQNLPAETKVHRVFIENQENGDYLGGQELVTHLGTAFYSRGRYVVEGAEIEEVVVYSLHPYADRIMTVTYRYPAGLDSSVRIQQLFDLFAGLEGL